MPQLVLIRTDSSHKIGTGHVMRCLTLADELRKTGAIVEFIVRDHIGNINELLRKSDFKVNLLPKSTIKSQKDLIGYEQWIGVKQSIDADETVRIVKDKEIDWLIVDHYGLDNTWEEILRPYIKKLMVIDDLANRKHDCDLLLDQNYINNKDRYCSLLKPDTVKLLGVNFALLRKEFVDYGITPVLANPIKRIFVFFGGSDPENLTSLAIQALVKPKLKHLLVNVVIGSTNPYRTDLKKEIDKYSNIKLHIQVDNIAALMSKSDLAIGAGGTSTWERIILGLPSIVITTADNQVAFTKDLDKDGYIKWLGNSNQVSEQVLYDALLDAINSRHQLLEQSRICKELINGQGAKIVSKLLTTAPDPKIVTVRMAKPSDISLYWYWANDSIVRKNAFNENNIEWHKHKEWFNNKLNNVDSILLLIEGCYSPIGQVRFERAGSHYSIDYCLAKQFRGHGLAKTVLTMAIDYLRQEKLFPLLREVNENDIGSKKVFDNLSVTEATHHKKKSGESFPITVLSDDSTWMMPWIGKLLAEWAVEGHPISWVHKPTEVPKGYFCFILSCSKIVTSNILSRNKHNLVVHASNLPKGKGMSPLSWQILEGKNKIEVTLFEAVEALDAGDIYIQDRIIFEGYELLDELRTALADSITKLCTQFVTDYPDILRNAHKQTGKESFYKTRKKENSKLDIDKSVRDQFQLLRIVDNEKYPAYFELNGHKYILKIDRCETAK